MTDAEIRFAAIDHMRIVNDALTAAEDAIRAGAIPAPGAITPELLAQMDEQALMRAKMLRALYQ